MAQPPISFDRATGVMQGANALERSAAMALTAGSKVSSLFHHRGYNACANLLRGFLPERDIAVRLNPDAEFSFPYGDGYWSKLLDRSYTYEDEIDLLLMAAKDIDYAFIDGGANYGYWSVLASSAPYGNHNVVAIEPSSRNFATLKANSELNGGRFKALHCAIGSARGTARLSGTKHEAFSIAENADGGEEVEVISLDNLIDDGLIAANGKSLVKLDVEGVEIEAIKGGTRLFAGDAVAICEEHGNDPNHTVSRFILDHTPMALFVFDPRSQRFEQMKELSLLDSIKVSRNVGYNVFATASAFWREKIAAVRPGAGKS